MQRWQINLSIIDAGLVISDSLTIFMIGSHSLTV
jgi:hypothetical protein